MHTSLDYPESQSAKNRLSYLVATADYIIIFKTRADAFAALPQLADVAAQSPDNATTSKPSSMLPPADPVHVIPLHAIISVFRADTVRAPFGIEIWWRMPYPAIATCSTTIYLKDGRDRENYLDMLASMAKIRNQDQPDASRVYYEVEECIRKIFQAEEPGFTNAIPEIFPVVYRNAPDRIKSKSDDKQLKKGQIEGVSSHYLVVGVNLCFFIQISRASAVQSTALEMKYQTCGLVTLESFAADWSSRDERFAMRFRDPFKSPVGLELSSRHYRRIILTLTKADKFLKPAWPTQWQIQEVFHVAGLPTPQHIVAGEDFGGFQRTLSAFYAAYRCNPVDWEINWRTPFAPEFRVLPSTKGAYTDLQLLAVLRALRYNDYFKSLSFCDVDLSSLLDKFDSSRKGNAVYMSRNGEAFLIHTYTATKSFYTLELLLTLYTPSPPRFRSLLDLTRNVTSTESQHPSPRVSRPSVRLGQDPADRFHELSAGPPKEWRCEQPQRPVCRSYHEPAGRRPYSLQPSSPSGLPPRGC